MSMYRRLGKQLKNISNSIMNVYRDGRPFELLKARLLDIMEKAENYEPVSASFEECSENSEE